MRMINTTIDIFGTIYTIEFAKTVTVERDGELKEVYGVTYYDSKLIQIASTVNGKKQPKEEMKLTLIHELIHAFLTTGQYLSCSGDEPLVEWLARCFNLLLKEKLIR